MTTLGDVPIGGSTGLCHEATAAIDQAAEWLLATPDPDRPRSLVPALRERFGLTAVEACQAIAASQAARLAKARATA